MTPLSKTFHTIAHFIENMGYISAQHGDLHCINSSVEINHENMRM